MKKISLVIGSLGIIMIIFALLFPTFNKESINNKDSYNNNSVTTNNSINWKFSSGKKFDISIYKDYQYTKYEIDSFYNKLSKPRKAKTMRQNENKKNRLNSVDIITERPRVKKKQKKGTYTVKCRVTASGDTNYKSGSRVVSFKIKVK